MPRAPSYAALLKQQQKERLKREAQRAAQESAERIESIKGAHRTSSPPIDWQALAAALSPVPPMPVGSLANSARRRRLIFELLGIDPQQLPDEAAAARQDAERAREAALEHASQRADHERNAEVSRAILRGELPAYKTVLYDQDFSGLAGDGELRIAFQVPSSSIVECQLTVETAAVLPTEMQAITASGKLTSKAIPRQQLVALYQDYVCSLVLRLSREIHALLPIDACIVTAMSSEGLQQVSPILSSIVRRSDLARLSFETLDPSDALDGLETRTNFKASRKSGAFQPIVAFTAQDTRLAGTDIDFEHVSARATALLEELE